MILARPSNNRSDVFTAEGDLGQRREEMNGHWGDKRDVSSEAARKGAQTQMTISSDLTYMKINSNK